MFRRLSLEIFVVTLLHKDISIGLSTVSTSDVVDRGKIE